MFDTKVALIVRDDLAAWQKLNVVAFLATGVAAEAPEALGEPYEDAAGRRYGRMLGQPMLVFSADLNGLQAAHRQALSREPRSCPTCTRCFRPGTTRPTATCFGPAMRRISTSSGCAARAEEGGRQGGEGVGVACVMHRRSGYPIQPALPILSRFGRIARM